MKRAGREAELIGFYDKLPRPGKDETPDVYRV